MKIERIQRLRNHKIFRNFDWPESLPTFSRFNLIYGWNASGKTTLSRLFGLLQSRGTLADGDVEFRISGQSILGSAIGNANLPPVRVFNADTVNRAVFESTDQYLAPVWVFGENSVEAQKQLEALETSLKTIDMDIARLSQEEVKARAELDTYCQARAREIKRLLTTPGGGPFNNFERPQYRERADSLLLESNQTASLDADARTKYQQQIAGQAMDEIAPIPEIALEIQNLTKEVSDVLKRTVTAARIQSLADNAAISTWVSAGLELHRGRHFDGNCLFCDQLLPPDRIAALDAHFNTEFKALQIELVQIERRVNAARATIDAIALPAETAIYPHIRERYKAAVNQFTSAKSAVRSHLQSLASSIEEKKQEPFKQLDLRTVIGSLGNEPNKLLQFLGLVLEGAQLFSLASGQDALKNASKLIAEHNIFAKSFSQMQNVAREAIATDEIVLSLPEYSKLKAALRSTEDQLNEHRKSLAPPIRNKIASLRQQVREHARPAEQLNKEMAAYLGRDEIRFEVKDTGYSISRCGTPATNLSEGERTAIAFMHFLKSLEDESVKLNETVVVIDDPVSSLDEGAIYSAFGFMQTRTQNAAQVFVLTHNFSFFRLARYWLDNLRREDRGTGRMYMLRTQFDASKLRQSVITKLDPLLEKYHSEYHYLFAKVLSTSEMELGSVGLEQFYPLPNMCRRLLEAFFAFKVPSQSGNLYLQMENFEIDPAKRIRVNRFIDTYSHNQPIGDDTHNPSVLSETPTIAKDVLGIIESIDPTHYSGMKKICSQLTS